MAFLFFRRQGHWRVLFEARFWLREPGLPSQSLEGGGLELVRETLQLCTLEGCHSLGKLEVGLRYACLRAKKWLCSPVRDSIAMDNGEPAKHLCTI